MASSSLLFILDASIATFFGSFTPAVWCPIFFRLGGSEAYSFAVTRCIQQVILTIMNRWLPSKSIFWGWNYQVHASWSTRDLCDSIRIHFYVWSLEPASYVSPTSLSKCKAALYLKVASTDHINLLSWILTNYWSKRESDVRIPHNSSYVLSLLGNNRDGFTVKLLNIMITPISYHRNSVNHDKGIDMLIHDLCFEW